MNVGFSKGVTGGVSATYAFEKNLVLRNGDASFHEILVKSSGAPVLLYCTKEDRGWVVPKLPVLELMLSIHIKEYGISDEIPPHDIDWVFTREKPLGLLQHIVLKDLLNNEDAEVLRITTCTVRKLLIQMSAGLDLTVSCCRYQQAPLRKVLWTDSLYGLELRNLALRHDEYYVKKHPLSHQASWLTVLEGGAIRGAILCEGLGDILLAGSCNSCTSLPHGKSYLAVVLKCLQYLKDNDLLSQDFGWDGNEAAFEKKDECSSFARHLQKLDIKASDTNPLTKHANGVVVFGRR